MKGLRIDITTEGAAAFAEVGETAEVCELLLKVVDRLADGAYDYAPVGRLFPLRDSTGNHCGEVRVMQLYDAVPMTCERCGRAGNRGFSVLAAKGEPDHFVCTNRNACERRIRQGRKSP